MTWPPTRKWLAPDARPFWALAVVALAEIVLFVGHHAERWQKSLLPRNEARCASGAGLVIRCDGHGYYAWLRSLLVDGDWSFDNEFDDNNPLGDWVPEKRTERGLRSNPWSVGPACIWSLTVVPAHFALVAFEGPGLPWRPDGYSLPYQLLVGLTTLLGSIVGLLLLYGICRRYARPTRAALAASFLTLGTTIVFYSAIEVAMAHGLATVALAALIWFWLKTYGSCRSWRWLVVGLLVGAAALMRWQLATFALLPAGECVLNLARKRRPGHGSRRSSLALLALAGVGAALSFLPQLVAWKVVYGHWMVAPMATAHNWLRPAWWQVLGSFDRGFLYWTPMALLAFAGFFAHWIGPSRPSTDQRAMDDEPVSVLFAAFIVQVYVVASLIGEEMTLGVSFGLRFFTESVVALAPGLALLLERASRRWFQGLCALGCGLVLWNLLLVAQYRYGWVPAAGGADPETLWRNAVRIVARKKLWVAGTAFGVPVLLWLLLGRVSGYAIMTPARDRVGSERRG